MERKLADQASHKAKKKTSHPDLESSELAPLNLEDFSAMICQEYPENGKKAERYLFNNYNHRKGRSTYT
eukprot:10728400-Prorocentrum_lima.AAC.1